VVSFLTWRRAAGLLLLLLAVVAWIPSGDVIDMIIRQKEIVLGRYSRGHFVALFVLSLCLVWGAGLCFSRLRATEMLAVTSLVTVSTVLSALLLVVASGWINAPRYIEKEVEQGEGEHRIRGLVRHRPPNEFYRLPQIDKPEQARSYPQAPAGYPAFELTLATDPYGFRNAPVNGEWPTQYDVVAVGDSFVAGSHVSDEQMWTRLLSEQAGHTLYNLGVSGADPGNYYNNFVLLGQQLHPHLVLFMIYEGNDFKKLTPLVHGLKPGSERREGDGNHSPSWRSRLSRCVEASPVTRGLRRFFSEVLEPARSTIPVDGYDERVGFMPLRLETAGTVQAYGFDPKRLMYLYRDKEAFRRSAVWQGIADIQQRLVALGQQNGFTVLFLYAPSTPHVVMPLMQERIPAEQLRHFAAYHETDLPDAETFKRNVFAWMDNEQDVFLETCAAQGFHCYSLTEALQRATARGEQVYYSYDQHWTPEGNRVVADALAPVVAELLR